MNKQQNHFNQQYILLNKSGAAKRPPQLMMRSLLKSLHYANTTLFPTTKVIKVRSRNASQ